MVRRFRPDFHGILKKVLEEEKNHGNDHVCSLTAAWKSR